MVESEEGRIDDKKDRREDMVISYLTRETTYEISQSLLGWGMCIKDRKKILRFWVWGGGVCVGCGCVCLGVGRVCVVGGHEERKEEGGGKRTSHQQHVARDSAVRPAPIELTGAVHTAHHRDRT